MSTLIKIITTFIISFSVFFPAKGAIVYQTKALHPSIQTIRTRVFDKAYFPPVIRLDNDDQLIVSFDKFAETVTGWLLAAALVGDIINQCLVICLSATFI